MGIETGANKNYYINDYGEVVFEDFYDDVEGECFKYPNAEFVRLSETLKNLSNGNIDIRKHLIWADIFDYQNPVFSHIIEQLNNFSFEESILEGEKAKKFIEENHSLVNEKFSNIHDAKDVIDYLITVWKKGYYVDYSN